MRVISEMTNCTFRTVEYSGRFSKILMSLLLILISVSAFAKPKETLGRGGNTPTENNIFLTAFPYNGETLPMITLSDFNVVASRTFINEKDKQAYLKLKRDVRKAYPYAILASVKLREYDAILANMSEKTHSPYLKKVEKELKVQFERDLKNLTMSQGKILIRLINRETGITTYKVIKDYRGSFSAFMWQSLGLLWGNNLKWKYDPSKGEDKLIEEIIQEIQDKEV